MVNNKGFMEGVITLYSQSEIGEGSPVSLGESNTAAASVSGDKFIGILRNQRCGFSAVQIKGYAEVGYSGDALTLGFCEVAADGEGKIKLAEGGREVLVLSIDEVASTVQIIM